MIKYILLYIWVWRRLVARYLGVVEAVGSNPATQTMLNVHNGLDRYEHSFLCTLVFEQVLPALFCYAGKAFGIYETETPCLVSFVKGLEKALSGISI